MKVSSIIDERAFRIATRHIIDLDELKEVEEMLCKYLLALPKDHPNEVKPILTNGELTINAINREVTLRGNKLKLTHKQFELLKFFMINKGRLIKYKEILNGVWGPGYVEQIAYVRVCITEIKKVIGSEWIQNIAKEGYMMMERA